MAEPSDDNCQFSTVDKAEKLLGSSDWDKVSKKLKMMFKEVQPKAEAEIKTEGAASTRIANLGERDEQRRMKVEEGSVDEPFERTSDFEESHLEADDEGFEEDSSGEEDGGGGDGRGSATESRARQIRGGRERNADAAGITIPESGDKSVATKTGAVPNSGFDHLHNKRKAKRSQLRFTLVK